MKISLQFMDQLQGISDWAQAKGFVRQQFEDLAAQISAGWNQEHNTDGTHAKATVTTNVVATGNITAAGTGTFTGQHRAFVKINPNQTLADNAETSLSWATPSLDGSTIGAPDAGWNVGGMFDPTQPLRLTAQVAGLYLINYSVRFAGSATGVRYVFVTVHPIDNTPADLAQTYNGAHAGGDIRTETLVLPMRAGDYITIQAYQNSAGNLDVIAGFLSSWAQITKIG